MTLGDNRPSTPINYAAHRGELDPPEPRWPALVAVVAVASLDYALPASMTLGPRWLVPAVVAVLAVATTLSHHGGKHDLNNLFGVTTAAALTAFLCWSLYLLVKAIPAHVESPGNLLRSATALWVGNVMTFALWYYRLDGGGPNGRDRRRGHDRGAFLFPQMTDDGLSGAEPGPGGAPWSPQFIDYLFVAFNTSTAFSPTDAPVLSRWAKVLTMIQATISLVVVALLAARAVNIF